MPETEAQRTAPEDAEAGSERESEAAEAMAQPEPEPEPAPRAREAVDEVPLVGLADGVGVRDSYAVQLDAFEGPLDLLLHLVRRHELDILDIPIAFITEKYIEYLEFARALDIEIAGDYLVMAATLAFLKSRELLPPDPNEEIEEEEEDDGVDPREELIRRLIEYERFRAAGEELDARPISGRDVFVRGGDLDVVLPEPDLAPVTLFRLAEAYNRILERARINKSHEVEIEPVTVRQRMKQLSLLLTDQPKLDFEKLFLEREWHSARELRQMLVVTLMSVLELAKLGVLSVHQAEGSATILLERVAEVDEVSRIVESFQEDDDGAGLAAPPEADSAPSMEPPTQAAGEPNEPSAPPEVSPPGAPQPPEPATPEVQPGERPEPPPVSPDGPEVDPPREPPNEPAPQPDPEVEPTRAPPQRPEVTPPDEPGVTPPDEAPTRPGRVPEGPNTPDGPEVPRPHDPDAPGVTPPDAPQVPSVTEAVTPDSGEPADPVDPVDADSSDR